MLRSEGWREPGSDSNPCSSTRFGVLEGKEDGGYLGAVSGREEKVPMGNHH